MRSLIILYRMNHQHLVTFHEILCFCEDFSYKNVTQLSPELWFTLYTGLSLPGFNPLLAKRDNNHSIAPEPPLLLRHRLQSPPARRPPSLRPWHWCSGRALLPSLVGVGGALTEYCIWKRTRRGVGCPILLVFNFYTLPRAFVQTHSVSI